MKDATRLLAQRLGPLLHLSTSSWSFPGWRGIVYEGAHDDTQLARDGLGAYAAHPLLRTVSVDRAYYGPLERSMFEDYARRVPEDFRFMVKAPADCTTPWLRGAGGQSAGDNPRFLDVEFAYEMFVGPASRDAPARMCVRSLRAGQPVYLVANNTAEGSAPLTVFEPATAIDRALNLRLSGDPHPGSGSRSIR